MYNFVIKRTKRTWLSRRQQFYFILVAPNGETVMTSELQSNRDDIRTTIQRMKFGVATATVVDDSQA